MAELHFDEPSHTYWLGERQLPSVTSVLQHLGGYEHIPAQALAIAAARGQAVHLACELDDEGDLDEASVCDVVRPYLDAWRRFREEKRVLVIESETMGYHPTHLYAGRRDRIIEMDGARWMLDIKTVRQLSASTGPQTAAYAACVSEPLERCAVQLKPDGRYVFKRYDDKADFTTFLSALNVHNWRLRHAA